MSDYILWKLENYSRDFYVDMDTYIQNQSAKWPGRPNS